MILFSIGNLGCAIAGNMTMLIIARVITAFAHASFFGISSVYAAELAPVDKRASAVSAVFLGATLANILGVPLGARVGAVPWLALYLLYGHADRHSSPPRRSLPRCLAVRRNRRPRAGSAMS